MKENRLIRIKDRKTILARTISGNKQNKKIPVWLMRQAGRSLPEYCEVVKNINNFMEICYSTDLVVKLTLQPIIRFDMDAAIIFSDILVVADAIGYEVNFMRGMNPIVKFTNNFKKLNSLQEIETKISPILVAIKQLRNSLKNEKSLIGFAGGPWTVASYITGNANKETFFPKVLDLSSSVLEKLIEQITETTIFYLIKQIESGVDVIQLFESNTGTLSKELFKKYIIKPTRKIALAIKDKFPNFPIIGFPRFAGNLYEDYCDQAGVSAISIDYQVPIEWARKNLKIPLQGNLDPSLLAYKKAEAMEEAKRIIDYFRDLPFIFNLGHGVLPNTPIENIAALVDLIKNY